MEGEFLTLQEAADRLKVHYMTAYRWVRTGQLPAFKVGGRLRVRGSDLERFLHEREVDVVTPAPEPGGTRWEAHVERLHDLLRAGRATEAVSLVRKVVADGAPRGDLYPHLLAPTLQRIGDDWATGAITVAEEHRATEIVHALVARLGALSRRRGPSRGTAVTLTPPQELHGLGSAMVADVLRGAGYDVHHLGVNVPLEDLRRFLQGLGPDLVAVSATNPATDPEVLAAVVAAARDGRDTVVVVGGKGADPALVEDAGGVYVDDLADLVNRLGRLLP